MINENDESGLMFIYFQGSNARILKLCLTWKRRASQGSQDFLGIIEAARQKCSNVETHLNHAKQPR
jgi:hypothetical protein